MARERLHIVVSCTDRKRAPASADLRLRGVSGSSIAERAARWWSRLRARRDGHAPAWSVYAGELWSASHALIEVAERAGFAPVLWVASAGYGLLEATAPIIPYSATFAAGSPDSVALRSLAESFETQNRAWWTALGKHPFGGQVRTLAVLAAKQPRSRFIVVGSPAYVGALADDLLETRAALKDPNGLIIVTSRLSPTSQSLLPNQITSSARLLARVGGTRVALHARVAADVLKGAGERGFDVSVLQRRHARVAGQYAPPAKLERTRMTDEEVLRFIEERQVTSYSAGIRELRSSGSACEQKRFRELFHSVGGTA